MDLMKLMNKATIATTSAPSLTLYTSLVLLVIVELHMSLLLYMVWDCEESMLLMLLLWLSVEIVLAGIVLNVGTEIGRLSCIRQLVYGLMSHVMWSFVSLRVLCS